MTDERARPHALLGLPLPVVAALAAGLVVATVLLASVVATGRGSSGAGASGASVPGSSGSTGSPGSSDGAAIATTGASDRDGPTAWYSILDADGLGLWRRRLDGRSEPARVAARPADPNGNDAFLVGPGGRAIVFVQPVEVGAWTIEGIDPATGTMRWRASMPPVRFGPSAWSADGRYWAATNASESSNGLVVLDATTGQAAVFPIPDGAVLQGWIASSDVVAMRLERDDSDGLPIGYGFLVLDPATGAVRPAPGTRLDVGPSSTGDADVAPAAGLAVTHLPAGSGTDGGDSAGEDVVVTDIASGARRTLAHVQSRIFSVAFDPAADAVLAVVAVPDTGDSPDTTSEIHRIGLDGSDRVVWRGGGLPDDVPVVSADGSLLAFATWIGHPTIVVASLDGTASSQLPLASGATDARIVRIDGGSPLGRPMVPPAAVPSPTPSPVLQAVVGAPSLVGGWLEPLADERVRVRVGRFVPVGANPTGTAAGANCASGALVPVDDMPPIVLPPGSLAAISLQLLTETNGSVLVVLTDDASVRAWRWVPGRGRDLVEVPAGWPRRPDSVALRPDGGLLAGIDPDTHDVVWFATDRPTLGRAHLDRMYDAISGWSRDGRSVIVSHGFCTEGCPASYPYMAGLSLDTGRLTPFPAEARVAATGGSGDPISTGAYAAILDGRHVEFDPGQGRGREPYDVTWPTSAGTISEDSGLAWSEDGSRLYLVARGPTDLPDDAGLYAVRAPGRGDRVVPERLGRAFPAFTPISVARGDEWALGTDGAAPACTQVALELRSGATYRVACLAAIAWLPGR